MNSLTNTSITQNEIPLSPNNIATPENSHKVLTVKRFWLAWLPIICVVTSSLLLAWSFIEEIDTYQLYYQAVYLDLFSLSFDLIPATTSLFGVWLVLLCATFIFAEGYFIRRIVQIRKNPTFSRKRTFLRFITAQLYVCASAIIFFLVTPVLLLIATFFVAHFDNKFTTIPTDSYINSQEEIIENVSNSKSTVNVYVGKNELSLQMGSVTGKTVYDLVSIPVLSQSTLFKQTDEATYFFPKTNSILLVSSEVTRLEDVLLALTHNRLMYSPYEQIAKAFSAKPKPTVSYVADEEYVDVLRKRDTQRYQEDVDNSRAYVQEVQSLVLECSAFEISNKKNDEENALDYQKNCVDRVHYNDCAEFKATIDSNIVVSEENIQICRSNRAHLVEGKQILEENIQALNDLANDELELAKYDGSAGIYFPGTKDIFMRITTDVSIYDYLHTLVHEYLHYYSEFGNLDIPQFINEGITAYLTYTIFDFEEYEFSQDYVSGYYRENQIILALLEKIPEVELIDFYFGKGPDSFEDVFVKYFPDVSYDTFVLKGDALFEDTYGVGEDNFEVGFWDTPDDHPAVRDLRLFLGLEEVKDFYVD